MKSVSSLITSAVLASGLHVSSTNAQTEHETITACLRYTGWNKIVADVDSRLLTTAETCDDNDRVQIIPVNGAELVSGVRVYIRNLRPNGYWGLIPDPARPDSSLVRARDGSPNHSFLIQRAYPPPYDLGTPIDGSSYVRLRQSLAYEDFAIVKLEDFANPELRWAVNKEDEEAALFGLVDFKVENSESPPPPPPPPDPELDFIEIIPPRETLDAGASRRFLVVAHYAGGDRTDVTGDAVIAIRTASAPGALPGWQVLSQYAGDSALVQAIGRGPAGVEAQFEGESVTAWVCAAPLASGPLSPGASESTPGFIEVVTTSFQGQLTGARHYILRLDGSRSGQSFSISPQNGDSVTYHWRDEGYVLAVVTRSSPDNVDGPDILEPYLITRSPQGVQMQNVAFALLGGNRVIRDVQPLFSAEGDAGFVHVNRTGPGFDGTPFGTSENRLSYVDYAARSANTLELWNTPDTGSTASGELLFDEQDCSPTYDYTVIRNNVVIETGEISPAWPDAN